MPTLRAPLALLAGFAAAMSAGRAVAHHEAIFGPQSSVFLSAPDVVSAQVFTKRVRGAGEALQDTTFLASVGYAPFDAVPISAVLTLPVGMVNGGDEEGHPHVEDLIVGLRYRFDLRALQERLGREGNYLLATAALEAPTSSGHGSVGRTFDTLAGALGSLEYRAFSLVLFGFGTLNDADADGDRHGHELFAGGGLAYTPIDTHEHLLSLQLGVSFERLFRDQTSGATVTASGGRQVVLSPTVVFGFQGSWQLFASVGLPVLRRWDDPTAEQRWRAATGVVYAFGG